MSNRRQSRQIFYVCSCIYNNELISAMIVSKSLNEAKSIFLKEYAVSAKTIFGPFYKKKDKILESDIKIQPLKFANNKIKKAIYDGWLVNSFELIEPINQAYLIFIKRINDKKIPTPKGIVTVPISDLRFIE